MFDPADSTRVLVYCSGMTSPVTYGSQSIGRFHFSLSNPYTWTEDGQILLKGTGGDWDAGNYGIRVGSVVYNAGTFYLYYNSDDGGYSIGLATSTDGLAFTKHGSNPILTPSGQGRNDGDRVSQPAVIREGENWTMIYSYRNGGAILPGLLYATSSDGVSWTKGGSSHLVEGPYYVEFHQLLKLGPENYVLLYESGDGSNPTSIYSAISTSPLTTFKPLGKLIAPSGTVGAFDRYHVATPCVLRINDTDWLLFYCGAGDHEQPYYTNTFDGGMATLVNVSLTARV